MKKMSKELEAMTYELSKKYPHNKDLQDYFCKVADLVSKTTPPTSEDLCRELGEHFNKVINFHRNTFYIEECFNDNDVLRLKYYPIGIFWKNNNAYETKIPLPPTLIKRITQFYEAEAQND